MTQDFSYDNSFYSGITPVEDLIIKHDAVDTAYKKMINLETSVSEKMDIIEQKKKNKELNMAGYQSATVRMDDPDSGSFLDANGQVLVKFRFDNLDALDTRDSKGRKQEFAMSLQNKQVAQMYGVPESEVTDPMWKNATNYQYNEFLKSFTTDNQFERFDTSKVYNPVDLKNTPINISFKPTGKTDDFGRQFIEAINPTSGRRVSFDMSTNPYLSARNAKEGFDIYTALRAVSDTKTSPNQVTPAIQNRLNTRSVQEIKDAFDTDGRLSETIDLLQSTAYRSAARILQFGPDFLVNNQKWKAVANEETGQQLADAWAGVKQSTRQDYQQKMQSAKEDFDKENYTSAIITIFSQFDRLVAESATQMGIMAAGTLITGGVAGAIGATSLAARTGAMFLGAIPAGLDVTLSSMEEYKANNDGKEMSAEDIARHWAINTALLVPQAFVMSLNFSKYLPKKLGDNLNIAYQAKALPSRGKVVGISALEEVLQEAAQESYETYSSQREDGSKKDYLDILFSKEGAFAGLVGGMLGGGLSGIGATLSLPLSVRSERNRAKAVEANIQEATEQTPLSTPSNKIEANQQFSNDTITRVNDRVNPISVEDLTLMAHHPELNREAVNTILKRRNELLIEQATEGTSTETKEELFKEYVFYSGPNERLLNAQSTTNITPESLAAIREQAKEVGKQLGLSNDFINKTMNKVNDDVRHGDRGYNTYRDNIIGINNELANTSITEDRRNQLETAKTKNESNLLNLLNNQQHKLTSIIKAVSDIASGTFADRVARYKDGGYFKVLGKNIVDNTHKSKIGVYGLIGNVTTDINEMNSIASELNIELGTDVKKTLNTLLNRFRADVVKIKENAAISKPVIRSREKEATKGALTDTQIKGQVAVLESFSDRLSKGRDISKLLTAFKADRTTEQLNQIKDYLEANSNEKASKVLSDIMQEKVEVAETKEEQKVIRETTIDTAEKSKINFTEELVSKLDTIKDVTEFDNKLVDIIRDLNQLEESPEVKSLLEYYRDIASKLETRSKEVGQKYVEELKAKVEEIEPIEHEVVPRSEIKAPARITKNGTIKLADDVSINDVVNLDKRLLPIFDKHGINYKELVKDVDPINFILLHEQRHLQQMELRDSFQSFMKDYNENPIKFELDAMLYALHESNLITDKQFKEIAKTDTETKVDTKDYVVQSIFETNSAIYSTNAIREFNLSNRLAIKNPHSILGVEDVTKYPYAGQLKSLNALSDNLLSVDANGIPIRNKKSYFNKLIDSSPYMRVLYDFIQDGTNISFKINRPVGLAVDFSIREFFASMSIDETFNPKKRKDAADLFGMDVNSEDFNNKYSDIRSIINKHGIPRTLLADRLGTLILNNLGIRQNNETGIVKFYDKVAAGLGTFAFRYAEANNWITQTEVTKEQWEKSNPDREYPLNTNPPFIKFNNSKSKEIRESYKKLEGYKTNTSESTKPNASPNTVSKTMKTKHTNEFMTVPSFMRGVFNKLFKTPFVLNTELVDTVLDEKNIKAIYKRLGQLDEIELQSLHFDDRESHEGINQSVTNTMNHLQDFREVVRQRENKSFFNYMFSKNGRVFMDVNTMNPQTNKFHRFLMLPEKMFRKFDPNNEKHQIDMYFAIAQAFDTLKTDARITEVAKAIIEQDTNLMMNDLIHLNEFTTKDGKTHTGKEAFIAKYKELVGIGGIENFGQALNVLQHIQKMKEANGKPFDSWLAIENDSTTSGYNIRFLQFPNRHILDAFGEKVGIIESTDNNRRTEIHNLKQLEGFLDIYKTMAKAAEVENIDSSVLQNNLKEAFNKMYPALPKPDADGSVSGTLRKLFKNPAMIFGYTAGARSITTSLSDEISSGMIRDYVRLSDKLKIDPKTKLTIEEQSVIDTFKYISSNFYKGKDLYQALKTKSVNDIILDKNLTVTKEIRGKEVTIKNLSLNRFFQEVLAPTYGQAVWDSLSKSFEAFVPYNDSMTKMFNTMFHTWDNILTQKMNVLEEKYGNEIPIKAQDEAINELFELMPTLGLMYDTTKLNEGMLLVGSERQRDDSTATQSYYVDKNNKTVSDKSYANVRKFIDSGKAGAVLPIHFIDGMIIGLVLDKYGDRMIGVHDAIVMSALDNSEITRFMNEVTFTINKDYDVFSELVDRFVDTVHIAMNEHGMTNLLNEPIFDKFNPEPQTINNFIVSLTSLVTENKAARDTFYDSTNKVYLTNVDGGRDSGFTATGYESFAELMFEAGWIKNRSEMKKIYGPLYSDPKSFTVTGKVDRLQEGGLDSHRIRDEIFIRLQAMDPRPESGKHLAYLRGVVSRVNPEPIKDLIVTTGESIMNAGEIRGNTLTLGLDNRTDIDPVTRLSPYSTKSASEIYAHELIHAGVRFGLANWQTLNLKKEVHQLLQIQKQVMDTNLITWEDFMPDGKYDTTMKGVYEQNAKDIWNYIFNNPNNIKNLAGLHEFIAYGLTNEKVISKLQSQYIKNLDPDKKIKMIDRFVNLAMSLLDVIRGKGKFKEVFKSGYELFKGNYSIKQRDTLFAELNTLYSKINDANEKGINILRSHPARSLEQLFKLFGNLVKKGNKIFAPMTQWAFNFTDELGWQYDYSIPIHGSMFEYSKMFANVALLTPFSKSRRQTLMTVLNKIFNVSQQGVFASIYRDVQAKDLQTARLEVISASARMLDQISKEVEGYYYTEMRERFNPSMKPENDLTEVQQHSLTKSVLYTDLRSLLEYSSDNQITNINEVIDYLRNPEKVSNEIKKLDNELSNDKSISNDISTYYRNQAMFLGRFMVTNEGGANLNLNATNIAEGRGTGQVIKATSDVINKIDRLATLYALQITDVNSRRITSELNKDGLKHFLNIQNNFVKESISEGITNPIHIVKGYSKALFDTSKDIKIGRLSDKADMKKIGYNLIKELNPNKVTGQSDLALYQRTWNITKRRDGSALTLTGANSIGTTLIESAIQIISNFNPNNKVSLVDANQMANQFKVDAQSHANDLTKLMMKKIVSFEEADKISYGYTPVVSPLGGFSDFRITMSTADKIELMGMSQNAFSIMSKMYATKNTKMSAPTRNSILVNFLEKDMKENMIAQTKLNRSGKNYVRLEPDSDNQFLKDAYKGIPKELREVIKKYNKEGNGFWVRDEWLQDLFGTPTVSMIDNKKVNDYTNNLTKWGITIAEQILKHIAYFAKQTTIIRYPVVLIGNIMSNLNLSIANGANPTRVVKKTIENAQNIRDYVDNKKALNRVLLRQKLHTATQSEINSINWYQTKLEHNPVKVLMDKGMYQAIVEDIAPNEIESIGKVNKWVETVARNKRVPSKVRTVLKHLYLMEGTPYFDLMFTATQYSDFAARATEYQLQMENAPKDKASAEYKRYEEQVTFDVWDAFINYDKPQSSKEQYLNDLGLMMYTKFAKRIIRVITKGLTHNPISSLLFLMSQSFIHDSPNIFEYTPGFKDYTWNFFNPMTNLITASIPLPLQILTGTGLYK